MSCKAELLCVLCVRAVGVILYKVNMVGGMVQSVGLLFMFCMYAEQPTDIIYLLI